MSAQSITLSPAVPAKLSVEQVSMVFNRDGKSTNVLREINLEVAQGEFLCLLGPSGCGKSTLLSTIAGFLSPSSGTVKIDGEVVTGPDPRRIFVFQERGVFPWLTVEGNIAFGLAKLSRSERGRRIAHYVKLVGLEGFEKAYPSELSGGMKQRLEVARALAVNPDMLSSMSLSVRSIPLRVLPCVESSCASGKLSVTPSSSLRMISTRPSNWLTGLL